MRLHIRLLACATAASLTACAAVPSKHEASAHAAHVQYETAINSQNADAFAAMLTEDAVFMPPNGPRMVGREALRAWAAGYTEAIDYRWDKSVIDIIVLGDHAIEQYAYESTETPRTGGETIRDTGKGIIVYRLEPDGVWRVCQDVWNSDQPE